MIDLYYWPTPNGWKVSIMLEECGLDYNLIPVNIGAGDQFAPEFLAVSPNNRMPAIVDHDVDGEPIAIFESGAILLYLAEKTGRFLATDTRGRADALQWLFWQMGGLGPMTGQLGHFRNYAPQIAGDIDHSYAQTRYLNEVDRLVCVMERRLKGRPFLGGDYSIADIASWPWVLPLKKRDFDFSEAPHVSDWYERIAARTAVQRGRELGKDLSDRAAPISDEAKKMLFGQTGKSVADAEEDRAGK